MDHCVCVLKTKLNSFISLLSKEDVLKVIYKVVAQVFTDHKLKASGIHLDKLEGCPGGTLRTMERMHHLRIETSYLSTRSLQIEHGLLK